MSSRYLSARLNGVVTKAPVLSCVALVAFTIAAYWPGWSAGFVWEDITHVVNNDTLRSFDGLIRIWTQLGATQQYYPLFYTVLWLQYQAFELTPLGYHVVGITLHAFNGVLLYQLLRRVSVGGAWFIAAIFALHPINVESAVFVTEQSNVLALTFYVLTLMVWSQAAGLTDDLTPTTGRRAYGGCLALFVLSLLAKTITVTLPVVMALLVWWRHGRLSKRQLVQLAPFFVLALVFGLITIWIERTHLGAQGGQFNFSVLDRVLIAGRTAWFYVGKLLWPIDLSPVYAHWNVDPRDVGQWLFPIAAGLSVALAFLWRATLGRGPISGIALYLVTLFPALGLIDYSFMRYAVFVGDHFQYIAGIAVIVLVVNGAMVLGRRFALARSIAHSGGAMVLAMLAIATWQLSKIYEHPDRFWRYAVETRPDAYLAHNNYGAFLASTGRLSEALSQYSRALEIYPASPGVHVNMGTALASLGRVRDAISRFEHAAELLPSYPKVYTKMGNALELAGRQSQAVQRYQQALKNDPDDAVAINNLAWIFAVHPNLELRNAEKAVTLANRARDLVGDDVNILDTLAAAYAEAGEFRRAVEVIDQALASATTQAQRQLLADRKLLYQSGTPLRVYR